MTASQIIMSAVAAAVTFLGVVLTQVGKKGDQAIQANKDQFGRLLDEARYWKENANDARDELEKFRDRQLARCRTSLDSAVVTISHLMVNAPPQLKDEGKHTIEDIEQHRVNDHDEG